MYSAQHLLVYSVLLFAVGVQCNSNRDFEIIFANFTAEVNSEYMGYEYSLKNAGTVKAAFSATMKILQDFPDNIDLSLRIERDVYGNYVTAGMPLQKSFCDFIKTDKAFYPTIIKYGEHVPRRCPIKKGEVYTVRDFNLNQFDLPMSILPNGDYRVTLDLVNFPRKSAKFRLFVKIQSAK